MRATALQAAGSSRRGQRDRQEDRLWIGMDAAGERALLAVADGMGGHGGGDVAAQILVDAAAAGFRAVQTPPCNVRRLLADICVEAHRSLVARYGHGVSAPRTTCALLYLEGRKATWTHLGDSRIYRVRQRRAEALTEDHSVLQLLLATGQVRPEDARNHPDQGRLLKCIGGREAPDLEINEAQVEAGDVFVLCTDGVWGALDDSTLGRISTGALPEEAAASLVTTAVRAAAADGQGDNASAIVARVGPEGVWRRMGRLAVGWAKG